MNRLENFDVFAIPFSEIFCDEEFNCRGEFTLQSVQELAASIRDNGLKFPIVVQPAADVEGLQPGYQYRLVAGYRRFIATSKHLQWNTIPSRVAAGLTPKEASLFNLLENLERKDLNQLEEAQALLKQFPHSTVREIAAEIHRSTKWVTQRQLLMRQPDEVRQMVASGRLTLQMVQEAIHPIKSKAAKIVTARRLSMDGSDGWKQGRREYRMKTRPRNRSEINDKIALMLEMGIHDVAPIVTRFAAWCARGISDEEINRDLTEFLNQSKEKQVLVWGRRSPPLS